MLGACSLCYFQASIYIFTPPGLRAEQTGVVVAVAVIVVVVVRVIVIDSHLSVVRDASRRVLLLSKVRPLCIC